MEKKNNTVYYVLTANALQECKHREAGKRERKKQDRVQKENKADMGKIKEAAPPTQS